jgi:thioredoxin reductase (NADPH)
MIFDCIVVGAGPAGLTAALYLARFGLSACVIADGKSRAARVPLCRNFPSHPGGISGEDLLGRMETQLAGYEVARVAGSVRSIEKQAAHFSIRHGNAAIEARTVILATGKFDEPPPLLPPDEHDAALREGRLHYCPICDAHEVRGRDVVILGTGGHGIGEARFLRSYTKQVTLLCPAGRHASSTVADDIAVMDGPLVGFSYCRGQLELTTPAAVLRPEHLYVALGCRQRSELAAGLGAALSEEGCIVVDAHQRTTIAGLYAAGDVVVGLDQIAAALGHAAIAATSVRNELLCA